MVVRLIAALLAAAVASCGPAAQPERTANGLNAEFVEAAQGSFAIKTSRGASCVVDVEYAITQLGDVSWLRVTAVADSSGVARATFRPRHGVPAGQGSYTALCTQERETVPAWTRYEVATLPFQARDLRVRVVLHEHPLTPRDDALEPLRAQTIEALHAQLAERWRVATRGLGELKVVERDADIVIRVVSAVGVSVYRRASDGTHDVILFLGHPVVGRQPVENIVATALHELGHIWCCRGPGTKEGHWGTAAPDPSLPGLDRFGLMNHPVVCHRLATGFLSCPDRFSDRELREMKLID